MGLHVQTATNADIPAWLELAAEVSDLFGVEMASEPHAVAGACAVAAGHR
jgi:hypothetical protein